MLLWPEHHNHLPPFHLRLLLDDADIGQILLNPSEQIQTKLAVGVLTTTKSHRNLGFIALVQETSEVFQLDLIIANISTRPELDLFNLNLLLLLARLVLLLFLIEPKASIIHQPTNRRIGIRNDLDEIKAHIGRPPHGLSQVENTDLLAVLGDQAYPWNRDLLIDAVAFWCSDSRLPPKYEKTDSSAVPGDLGRSLGTPAQDDAR